ncbi:MAG TPA: Rrf2 family transcriptional regulator [Caulobacteraceae bacterium]|jgi:Rrf2 family nitric oxide-sensitive transcriptional repressor
MRLTAYTDYSLRVLMYLALHPDRRPTIAEIAGRYGISKAHLMKVVYQLGLKGYVETVRGKGGGLRLAKALDQMTVGEIVRQTEPDMALVTCFDDSQPPCVIAPACRLKGKLGEARAAFLKVLDDCTLAEVMGNRPALAALLAS